MSSPIYYNVFKILKNEIKDGIYDSDLKLPSEKNLCERFGIQRNTVRQALKMLVDEGLIERRKGYGTTILKTNIKKRVLYLSRLSKDISKGEEKFQYDFLRIFESEVAKVGFTMQLCAYDDYLDIEKVVRENKVDALIISSLLDDKLLAKTEKLNIPIVFVNRKVDNYHCVIGDDEYCCEKLGENLINKGHRKFGIVYGKKEYQTTYRRESGFLKAISGVVKEKDIWKYQGDYSFESGMKAAKAFANMKEEDRPSAIFAMDDEMAYGMVNGIKKDDEDPFGQIEIVGYDALMHYVAFLPKITSVKVNQRAMAKYVMIILEKICLGEEDLSPACITVPGNIVS